MKRAVTVLVLVFCLIVVMSVSGAKLEGGGGYQASQVADIYSGPASSKPWDMIEFNGKLYFRAEDGSHGLELWEYDGISAPKMTADIRTGLEASSPQQFAVYKNKLYFSAYEETYGRELWVYDGINPPSLVMNINPNISGADLMQGEVAPGPEGSNPAYLSVYKDKLYFQANDGSSGVELWEYDGSSPPSRTRDIYPGASSSNPEWLTVFNDKLYFSATDGIYGTELWEFDAVVAPSMALDIFTGGLSSHPQHLAVFGNKLYFQANNGVDGAELLKYDGINPPLYYDIYPGALSSAPKELTVFNSMLYFSATDPTYGRELHRCSSSSCSLAADIVSGTNSSLPQGMAVFNDKLFFRADTGVVGFELWQFNGIHTPVYVADIYSGAGSSNPAYLTAFKDKLFFAADDGVDGQELWEYGPQTLQDMFYSQSTYDGWVLETEENTNAGGLINTTNLVCNIGDDALNRQFRTILHFNTSRLPDNAYVTKVSVQYKQHSTIGSDPYATHGNVWVDIKDGYFSNNPGLVGSDFGAGPSLGFAGWFSLYPSALAYPIYRSNLKAEAMQYLNVDGSTQFRLRFGVDDDNDNTADYIKIFCGDMPVPFNRPVLRVWYYYDPD